MNQAHIRGLVTTFHRFVAGSAWLRVMDQSLRNAGVAVSRVTPIVARVASPGRSGRMNFLPVLALRKLRLGRRYRPDETRQFARHRDADLVYLPPRARSRAKRR